MRQGHSRIEGNAGSRSLGAEASSCARLCAKLQRAQQRSDERTTMTRGEGVGIFATFLLATPLSIL